MKSGKHGSDLERLLDVAERFKEDTVREHRDELQEALSMWDVIATWSSEIIFENYGGVCPVTNMLGEAGEDLKSSVLCVAFGRYRTAMSCLRSFLELPFCGLYYDRDETRYEQDVLGPRGTVRLWKALDDLFGAEPFKEFNARYHLRSDIAGLSRKLSGFVHARGHERSEEFLGEPVRFRIRLLREVPACDSSFIEAWRVLLNRSFDVVNTALFLRYPDVLIALERVQTLSSDSLHAVASSLTKERRKQLTSVLGSHGRTHPPGPS
jgi:hypothetical protein